MKALFLFLVILVVGCAQEAGESAVSYSPLSTEEIVRRHAERAGIPFALVSALIHVESGWNPDAIGYNRDSKGRIIKDPKYADHGLMQINAGYARLVGETDLEEIRENIELNVALGIENLATCYEIAKKNRHHRTKYQRYYHAVACYNAGPKNTYKGQAHADKVMTVFVNNLIETI